MRLFAAQRLDVDYDEPVYLSAAVSYANYMRAGDLKMLAWNEHTYEHPALYKILYGVVLLTQQPLERVPESDLPRQAPIASTEAGAWNIADRYLSAACGTLAVLALGLMNPLAGLFLGVDTLSVKYTSEVYLEALPMLSSLLCALAYSRWFAIVRAGCVFSSQRLSTGLFSPPYFWGLPLPASTSMESWALRSSYILALLWPRNRFPCTLQGIWAPGESLPF